MWYVIQTMTGGEEELIGSIRQMVPVHCYEECFVIKREETRKAKKGYVRDIKLMFPGYVFVVTDTPELLFYELKNVPKVTKILGNSRKYEIDRFVCVSKEEQHFLEMLEGNEGGHIVKCSPVDVDEEGKIKNVQGPLKQFKDRIVRQRIRKRYVWVEQELFGKKRKIVMGIKLNKDDQ